MNPPRPAQIAARLLLALLVALQPAWAAMASGGSRHGCDERCCCTAPDEDAVAEPLQSCCSAPAQAAPASAPASKRCSCRAQPDPTGHPTSDLATSTTGPDLSERIADDARASALTPAEGPGAQARKSSMEVEPPILPDSSAACGPPGAMARRLALRGIDALLAFFGVFLR